MKERPILFSAPMVRAILDGSKTQTRRVVKQQPPAGHAWSGWCVSSTCKDGEGKAAWAAGDGPLLRDVHRVRCPYGQPGDRLWVRETFALDDNGHNEWPVFRADGAALPVLPSTRKPARWVPSIHMPRWASRILLEIVSVRVERLNDISESDARAEGCKPLARVDPHRPSYRTGFRELWGDINGAGSWDANPWVWVVEFKRVTP